MQNIETYRKESDFGLFIGSTFRATPGNRSTNLRRCLPGRGFLSNSTTGRNTRGRKGSSFDKENGVNK